MRNKLVSAKNNTVAMKFLTDSGISLNFITNKRIDEA